MPIVCAPSAAVAAPVEAGGTGRLRQRKLNGGNDEYFTKPEVAESLVTELARVLAAQMPRALRAQFVEPACGAGAFVAPLQRLGHAVVAFDVNPQMPARQRDFLQVDFDAEGIGDAVFVGNPPFGFASGTAVKFFNKAAQRALVIAFVLPRTFKKAGVQARLHPFFHLIAETDLPGKSFLAGGVEHAVPCVFQIWRREAIRREAAPAGLAEEGYLEFTDAANAQFAIRRVGGNAGKIFLREECDLRRLSATSNYFCREKTLGALAALQTVDFSGVVENTVGPKSLSKREINGALSAAMEMQGAHTKCRRI